MRLGGGCRMSELRVGVAERLGRARQCFEQRLQGREAASVGVGARMLEPVADVHDQNESVARTLMGIMNTLCSTGVWKRLTTYLNETSTPNGPEVTPPPPSAK